MLDGQKSPAEIYVLHSEAQSFSNSAAQMEECADKQLVPQIGRRILHLSDFFWFQVCLHRFIVYSINNSCLS